MVQEQKKDQKGNQKKAIYHQNNFDQLRKKRVLAFVKKHEYLHLSENVYV